MGRLAPIAVLAIAGLGLAGGVVRATVPYTPSPKERAFEDRMAVTPIGRYAAALYPNGGAPDFVRLKVGVVQRFDLRARPTAVRGLASRPGVPFLCVSQRETGTLTALDPMTVGAHAHDQLYAVAPPSERARTTDRERDAYCAQRDPAAFAEAPDADAVADAGAAFQALLALSPAERRERAQVTCSSAPKDVDQGPYCNLGPSDLASLVEVTDRPCADDFMGESLRFMRGPACLELRFSDQHMTREAMRVMSTSVTVERGKPSPHYYVYGFDNTMVIQSQIPRDLWCRLPDGVGESEYFTGGADRSFIDDYGVVGSRGVPLSDPPHRLILVWFYGPRHVYAFKDTATGALHLAVYEERSDGGVDRGATYAVTPESFCATGARALGLPPGAMTP